ncbi:hypothetical protein [Vibrio sp. WXL103]|uniref:hypothetical protein n=1 Tax=unclassified Vibrio TaxID=2614977 RepID=UPI003EC6C0D2
MKNTRNLVESITEVFVCSCLLFVIDLVLRIVGLRLLSMTGNATTDMLVICILSFALLQSGVVRFIRLAALGLIRS